MINWLIDASLRNRFLVVVACLLVGVWGYWALSTTPVDAIPDLSDNQVIVFADWPGRSPQEVEDQVTYPLSVNLQGLPGVRVVRASSTFGFSMINVIFEDDVDNYFARSRVLERLNLLAKSLPAGVIPTLGPDATGLGQVFWYTVEGPGRSCAISGRSRTGTCATSSTPSPAWPRWRASAASCASTRSTSIPTACAPSAFPSRRVVDAVLKSNLNVGGKVIEENGTWTVIRGLGLIETRARPGAHRRLAAENGTPIYLRDVATVQLGGDFRRGALDEGRPRRRSAASWSCATARTHGRGHRRA